MQIEGNAITAGTETSTRMPHSDVLLHRQPQETQEQDSGERVRVIGDPADGFVKSSYLLLISRLEDMLSEERVDEEPLAQLRALLSNRMSLLPEDSRQRIQSLPEFQATGAFSTKNLPALLDTMLRDRSLAETSFNLLRHPLFGSFMKDDRAAVVYGPQGLLRAS